ncbi:Crp/Fnr family transcriptional regulator [Rhizohabitans arisaemae]|uniref:Crp/Fnr family transcriptional regulator n=1 Tax=Rhizohabitans arisaemae TaxID=2720610 RepID=UPI0024B1E0DB|nr:Crp/Fnr family transcriptional regulator [Rhizohabitans arisaemae]
MYQRWQSLLDTLPSPESAVLRSQGTARRYARGEWLIHQCATESDVILITGGFVKVVGLSGETKEVVLAFRSAGDLVGEFALILGQPRSASVIATTDLHARTIGRGVFESFLHRYPRAREHVQAHVARKTTANNRHKIRISGVTARMALARTVFQFAQDYGQDRAGAGVRLAMPLSHRDLASYVNIGTATVDRELNWFRVNGILSTGYRHLVILDMDRLSQAAAEVETPG